MSKQIIIIGASGHGSVVADIAKKTGYSDIRFLDDNDNIKQCASFPVVGTCADMAFYKTADCIVAIGNASLRKRIQEELVKTGLSIATLIHPNAVVADSAIVGPGTVVMAGAVVNPGAKVGAGCIVNTCASVDHDCMIGDYVHVSVGAHIAGTVVVGNNTWIGAGAIVNNNIKITENCIVGSGAVVVSDLEESDTYVGVPARKMGR